MGCASGKIYTRQRCHSKATVHSVEHDSDLVQVFDIKQGHPVYDGYDMKPRNSMYVFVKDNVTCIRCFCSLINVFTGKQNIYLISLVFSRKLVAWFR